MKERRHPDTKKITNCIFLIEIVQRKNKQHDGNGLPHGGRMNQHKFRVKDIEEGRQPIIFCRDILLKKAIIDETIQKCQHRRHGKKAKRPE